jgi:hypothetical protein
MQKLDELLNIDVAKRDEAWEASFLAALPETKVNILSPEPKEGPDHWPYLMVGTGEGADEPLINVIGWLSTKGIGLAVNPQKPMPDFVLPYGVIWNFRERGEFYSKVEAPKSERFDIKPGQQLWTGVPSEAYLPQYVRSILKQFLADQGVFAPKVLMVSFEAGENGEPQKSPSAYDLCFSVESLKSPPAHEHANIAEALSWFLPAHYSVALVSEKTVPGFQPL